jgi:hypothetical protein
MPYGSISVDQINNTTGYSLGAGDATSMKNRLINGAMVIDQRNGGASVSMTTSSYSVDRFRCYAAATSKMTVQQNAGSVTPPVGFTNYMGFTTTTGYSNGSTDRFICQQGIEGVNVADLGWGTASAKTVTVSFWARSSLTGTFNGSLINDAGDRSYVFTYTITSANTWEYKSVTIPGCTDGAWVTTNTGALYFIMNLGTGSAYSTSSVNSWQNSYLTGATGAQSVVGTTGATFYITGIQFEVGSSATGFEYRSYPTEMQYCQRYFQMSYDMGQTPGQNIGDGIQFSWASPNTSSIAGGALTLPVSMRAAPTVTIYDRVGNAGKVTGFNAGAGATENVSINTVNYTSRWIWVRIYANGYYGMGFNYTASSEI